MIYLLYGQDFQKRGKKLHKILGSLKAKRPDASIFRVDEEELSEDQNSNKISELVGSQVLFGGNYVVIFESVFSVAGDELKDRMGDMAESEHVFIFVEDKLKASEVKVFEKEGARVEVFESTSSKPKKFNIFSIAEALASRQKNKLWMLYMEALRNNLSSEEIAGVLFWQIKTLLLVMRGDTKGVKPFSVSKAKRSLGKWNEDKLEEALGSIVEIYHEARRGGRKMEEGLELFVLSI